MSRETRTQGDEAGLTIIEVLVTTVLVALVGALVFSAILGLTRATAVADNVTFDTGFARNAMGLVSRDVRAAARVQQSSTPAFRVATPRELEFTANLQTGPRPELVTVEVDAESRLVVTAIAPDATPAAPNLVFDPVNARERYITSFVVNPDALFRFFDDSGAELVPANPALGLTATQRAEIATVEIDLLVNQAPRITGATELTTTVRLPNAGAEDL